MLDRPVDPSDSCYTACCCVPWCVPCALNTEERYAWRFWLWRRFFKGKRAPKPPPAANPQPGENSYLLSDERVQKK